MAEQADKSEKSKFLTDDFKTDMISGVKHGFALGSKVAAFALPIVLVVKFSGWVFNSSK